MLQTCSGPQPSPTGLILRPGFVPYRVKAAYSWFPVVCVKAAVNPVRQKTQLDGGPCRTGLMIPGSSSRHVKVVTGSCDGPQGHPELENLRRNYFEWLIQTGQYHKAGVVREKQGDFQGSVNLYLKAGLPTKAARLVMEQPEMSSSSDSISRILDSLTKGEFYERVSELPSSPPGRC